MIVVDSNTIAYFFIEGEHSALAHQVRAKDANWVVPALWRHEFLNILAIYAQQGGLSLEACQDILAASVELLQRGETPVEMAQVLSLAVENGISAYDAQFVWLARTRGARCVIQDEGLLRKFPDVAVSMQDFCEKP
jgi:predicted nucleic acid-binding protein